MDPKLTDPIHILHIGGNLGQETSEYIDFYRDTLSSITYIECIPQLAIKLKEMSYKYSKQEKIPIHVVEALVSDISNIECTFYLASNDYGSSSMLEPNPKEWIWDYVSFPETVQLKTTTCDELLKKGLLHNNYDALVIDVQGAELKVLKGMTSLLSNVKQIITEYSKHEYYKGGVQFDDLDAYIRNQGFYLSSAPIMPHGNVYYTRDE